MKSIQKKTSLAQLQTEPRYSEQTASCFVKVSSAKTKNSSATIIILNAVKQYFNIIRITLRRQHTKIITGIERYINGYTATGHPLVWQSYALLNDSHIKHQYFSWFVRQIWPLNKALNPPPATPADSRLVVLGVSLTVRLWEHAATKDSVNTSLLWIN